MFVASYQRHDVYGQSVRLTASVKSVTAATTGTVTIKNGVNVVGSGVLSASGLFVLTLANLPVGTNSLTAVYAGNANFKPSTSTASLVTVDLAKPSVVLQSSSKPFDVWNQHNVYGNSETAVYWPTIGNRYFQRRS